MVKPFNAVLKSERESANRSQHDAARGVSVPIEVYRSWEDGQALPTRSEFGRLCKHFRRLRHSPPEFFNRVVPAGLPLEIPDPEVVMPAPALTFGQALRAAREAEGMGQDEVGALMPGHGVTKQAVGRWELDQSAPVKVNYEALLTLFQSLADASEPDWRNIDTPDGGRGVPRDPPSGPGEEAAPPTPRSAVVPQAPDGEADEASEVPEPLDAAERVLRAYEEVHGGTWFLTTRRDGAKWRVSVSRSGPGDGSAACDAYARSVAACHCYLLNALDVDLERRIEHLQAIRASVRDANGRKG